MASVDWIKKIRAGPMRDFPEWLTLLDTMEKMSNINNKHVNKELSHLNYEISAKGVGRGQPTRN